MSRFRHKIGVFLFAVIALPIISLLVTGIPASAENHVILRVGLYQNEPKLFTDDAGKPSGFWPDVLQAIADKEGWELKYVTGTWEQCLGRLSVGAIDIMPDIAWTEARSLSYGYTQEPVYTSWSMVYAGEDLHINSILDLEGTTIGVLKDSINYQGPAGIVEMMDGFDLDCTYQEYGTYREVLMAVESGAVDAGVTSKDFGYLNESEYKIQRTGILFQPSDLYFAFPINSVNREYLTTQIDRNIRLMKDNQNSAYYLAMEKWLGVGAVEKGIPAWLIWLLAGIGGLALLFGVGSLLLRGQVRRKTVELTKEVSGRLRAEVGQRESDEKFSVIFYSNPNPIIIVTPETAVINDVNDAFLALTGLKREACLGSALFEQCLWQTETDRNHFRDLLLSRDEIHNVEVRILDVRQEVHHVILSLETISIGGEPVKIITCNDVTEQKRFQEQLIITDRLASVGELAAGIAHELNNPLTGVIGYADLLMARKDLPEEAREDITVISREAIRASRVSKNLLTFARKHPDEKVAVSVTGVMDDILDLRAYQQRGSNIIVNRNYAENIPIINANAFELQQVFLNIVINAEHFMIEKNHGGTLEITVGPIENGVRISIKDDGPGINPDNLLNIFSPFFTTKAVGKGTGLGLSICHGIITDHGGNIHAESVPGEGAEFIIELPSYDDY